MRNRNLIAFSVSLALASLSCAAAEPAVQASKIREVLQSRFPEIRILDVKAVPETGLFEVFTGDAIAYANETGDFLVLGSLVDTRTKQNLTSESMDVRNSINFDSLPVGQAIKVVKGNGSRKIAVFSDPDCPYCQQLEKELAAMTDVTVYTYLYPLEKLHPAAPAKAKAIWCAKDRSEAWTKWMLEQHIPEPQADCSSDPVNQLVELGKELRINSTPTMFLPNGRRISGALSSAELEKALAAAASPSAAR